MDITGSLAIAASGMTAQSARIRLITQNIANADSTATAPGQDPYRRQIISFKSVYDSALGANVVQVAGITADPSDFRRRFDPGHPAADASGYVTLPNVNPIVETADLQEAERSYQASLSAMDLVKTMMGQTISEIKA